MTVRRAQGHVALRRGLAACAVVLGAACSSPGGSPGSGGQSGTAGPAGHGGNAVAGSAGTSGTSGTAGASGTKGGGGSGDASGAAGGGAGAIGTGGSGRAGQPGTSGTGGGAPGSAGAMGAGCGARTGLLFCDDFEARTGLTGPWTAQINGSGTVALDTTTGHSGTRSVHVHAGDNDFDTFLALHDATVLPAPNGRFYLRAYVRLGRAMSAGHNAYLIGEAVSGAGANTLRLGEMNEMLMYTIAGDTHGALSNQNYYSDHKPGVSFPASTWVCLELSIDHAKPEIDVWVGGVEVPDLHHTDWPIDNYDTLRFGFEKYAGPGLDVWYDDIAVGTARIGCD